RRPPELSVAAEHHGRDLIMFQHQAYVPIEFEAEIQPDPVDEFSERGSAGQKTFVLIEGKWSEADSKLVLTIPDERTSDRPAAKYGTVPAEIRAFARTERHPVTDKLLDLHRHAEKVLKDMR